MVQFYRSVVVVISVAICKCSMFECQPTKRKKSFWLLSLIIIFSSFWWHFLTDQQHIFILYICNDDRQTRFHLKMCNVHHLVLIARLCSTVCHYGETGIKEIYWKRMLNVEMIWLINPRIYLYFFSVNSKRSSEAFSCLPTFESILYIFIDQTK